MPENSQELNERSLKDIVETRKVLTVSENHIQRKIGTEKKFPIKNNK